MIYVLLTVALSPKNAENHRKADGNSRAGGVGKFLVYYREEKVLKKTFCVLDSLQYRIRYVMTPWGVLCGEPGDVYKSPNPAVLAFPFTL